MASSSKKRTSFMKMNRERELAEAGRKQEKREANKQAAAEAAAPPEPARRRPARTSRPASSVARGAVWHRARPVSRAA